MASTSTQKKPKPILKNEKMNRKPKSTAGETKDLLGLSVKKDKDFSKWYHELVVKSEMIEYYNEISGFYILRHKPPKYFTLYIINILLVTATAMSIWTTIRTYITTFISSHGVEETSFPLFLSSQSLQKEKKSC